MSFLLHFLIFTSYCVVATATGLILPEFVATVGPEQAPFVGVAVFLGFAILHVAFAQAERMRQLRAELRTLRQAHGRVAGDLTQARGEAVEMSQVMAEAQRHGHERVKEVAAEVKIIQDLIGRLSQEAETQTLPGVVEPQRQVVGARPQLSVVPGSGAHRPSPPPVSGDDERPSMPPVAEGLEDAQVLQMLREGLRLDRVDVYLQPIVSLPQRKTRYYECFTRVRSHDGKVIVPDQYIELAEREGLVSTIDNMLLFRCVQLVRRTLKRNRNTAFFCNISKASLDDQSFFGDFVDFVVENGDLAPRVVFEFPQAELMQQFGDLAPHLERLSRLGFRFSMDQVGDLRLNFPELERRRLDFIKLDAGRLLRAAQGGGDTDIDVRDMRAAFDRCGIDMIVEKVETEEQVRELLDFNIDFGQGYLFGEPRLSKDG